MRLRFPTDAVATFAACVLAFGFGTGVQAQTTPNELVREFFVRYAAGDLHSASELWVTGAPKDDFVRRHRARLQKRCMHLESIVIDVVSTDPAILDATSEFTVRSALPASPPWWESSRSRFTLKRDGERWRIGSWEPREQELIDRLIAVGPAEPAGLLDSSTELQTTTFVRLASKRSIGLINEGRYAAANLLVLTAMDVAERLGEPVSMAVSVSAKSVSIRARREIDRAAFVAEEAVALAERAGDPEVLAGALVRLARSREEQNGMPDAEALSRALALTDELEDLSIAAHAAVHLGRTHELEGRFREAFRYAELSSRLAEESGNAAARISAELFLGGAYCWIGDWALSERHNLRAAELAGEVGFEKGVAGALASQAGAVALGRDAREAMRILDEALRRTTDPLAMVSLVWTRANLHLTLDEIDAAEKDLKWAENLLPNTSVEIQDFEIMRGVLAERRGDVDAALAHFDRATSPNEVTGRNARHHRAKVLIALGRVEEARGLLETLIAESEGTQMVDPQRQIFHVVPAPSLHLLMIELLVGQGDTAAAFEISEELKATELRSVLAHRQANLPVVSSPETTRERAIDARVRQLNRRLISGKLSREEGAAVRGQLAEARSDLLDFRQRLYATEPESETKPRAGARIEDLPAQLDDAAIVSYVVGPTKIVVFVLEPKRNGRRKLVTRDLPVTGLTRRIANLSTLIEQRNLRAPEAAAEMYELLLRPIEPQLHGARSLCIIPDGSLWRVPFHALGPRGGTLLVERMPVFYAPSLTLLAGSTRRARRPEEKPRLLAFANPTVGAETASLYRAFDPDVPLGAIPETESEVSGIAAIYGKDASRIYVGQAAREITLKHEASQYDILHIATHGMVYDNAPMFSSLLLTASPEDETEDGVLEAREIAGLALNAELAVLSACETGRANSLNGGGVIGLAWAFLAAGCPTTVVSQWKAQSAATATLMVDFHRHLARGLSKPDALRHAQLALRRDPRYRHAFYWAPFVVIGVP